MDSGSSSSISEEVAHDFPPFFKVYKDGRVERGMIGGGGGKIPTGTDSATGVQSKDVVMSSESGVSARIFLPKIEKEEKLPILIHYHGGGFCVGSPFDSVTQGFLTKMATLANVVAISVDYRLGPENPLPTAHEDAFEALKWIASHGSGTGPDPWINQYVDLDRVFITGESAGANIAHYVAVKAGTTKLSGLKIVGSLIVHPFFAGEEPDKMIMFMYPTTSGTHSDPLLSAVCDPNVSEMAGERVLVCVAERDWLKDRGVKYYDTLCSVWKKKVEFVETKEVEHCFHMFTSNEKAEQLIQRMADFINQP